MAIYLRLPSTGGAGFTPNKFWLYKLNGSINFYNTFSDAETAAVDGETISCFDNVSVDGITTVQISKSLNILMNGYNIAVFAANNPNIELNIINGGKVAIWVVDCENGKINCDCEEIWTVFLDWTVTDFSDNFILNVNAKNHIFDILTFLPVLSYGGNPAASTKATININIQFAKWNFDDNFGIALLFYTAQAVITDERVNIAIGAIEIYQSLAGANIFGIFTNVAGTCTNNLFVKIENCYGVIQGNTLEQLRIDSGGCFQVGFMDLVINGLPLSDFFHRVAYIKNSRIKISGAGNKTIMSTSNVALTNTIFENCSLFLSGAGNMFSGAIAGIIKNYGLNVSNRAIGGTITQQITPFTVSAFVV